MAGGLDSGVAVASGVLVLLLGAPLLVLRSRRSHALAFGLFCVAWGIQVVAGNLTNVVKAPGANTAITLLFLEATIIIHVPLAYFAASFTSPRAVLARRPWAAARFARTRT